MVSEWAEHGHLHQAANLMKKFVDSQNIGAVAEVMNISDVILFTYSHRSLNYRAFLRFFMWMFLLLVETLRQLCCMGI